MSSNTATASGPIADSIEVMASIDVTETGERLVIADITNDDAWLSMRRPGRSLSDWA